MEADNTFRDCLSCIVCTRVMLPPILNCTVGHSICGDCAEKVNHCPVCRAAIGTSRNYMVEKLVDRLRIPCLYHEEGCNFKGGGMYITEHEKFCDYSIQQCPFRALFDCTWTGEMRNVFQHCQQEHPRNTFDTFQLCLGTPRRDVETCHFILLRAFGKMFKLRWILNCKEYFMKLDIVFWGSVTDKEKFTLVVYFHDPIIDGEDVRVNLVFEKKHCGVLKEFHSSEDFRLNYCANSF